MKNRRKNDNWLNRKVNGKSEGGIDETYNYNNGEGADVIVLSRLDE